eukprot:2658851-Amphidinium_carterae.1
MANKGKSHSSGHTKHVASNQVSCASCAVRLLACLFASLAILKSYYQPHTYHCFHFGMRFAHFERCNLCVRLADGGGAASMPQLGKAKKDVAKAY